MIIYYIDPNVSQNAKNPLYTHKLKYDWLLRCFVLVNQEKRSILPELALGRLFGVMVLLTLLKYTVINNIH